MHKSRKKAIIYVLQKKGRRWVKVREIPVLFYPSEYTQVKSANYPEKTKNKAKSEIQFTGDKLETLKMDLFFDTYESNEDVRIHTNKITDLMKYDYRKNMPKVLRFVWGPINFTCVLESVTKKFTMFNKDGVPVRATLTVDFKEYAEGNAPRESPSSQGMTQVRSLKAGDSLWSIAADAYGSASMWRSIAEKNNISNPRLLVPGKEIIIPPLK
ncbi:MAG TPA: phage tail protein [Methanotrichaceae archaeon]|nr:phage tail protein [Methanotrichaceae archaeon]